MRGSVSRLSGADKGSASVSLQESNMAFFRNRMLTAGLAVAVGATAFASAAEARGWSYTGGAGRTYSHSVTSYNNGGGNVGRTFTTTGPNGKTATNSFNRSVGDGTITDSRTVTGFNGNTATRTLTRTPGEGGSFTETGPGGQNLTRTW
jgi:hypothetical protein